MSVHRPVISLIALIFLATPLIAQSSLAVRDTTPSIVSAAPDSAIVRRGVIDRSVSPQLSWRNASAPATTDQSRVAFVRSESESKSTSTTMMLVGGAGLLVGGIMGGTSGTVFMIGGGLVGLAGLWGYLR